MSKRTLLRFAKCSLALAAFCLLLWPKSVLASPVTYTYTGNPFTFFSGLSCPPDCRITGSFTLSAPLGDNFYGVVNPTSFSFTVGNFTLFSGEAGLFAIFSPFSTNGSGAITDWFIDISNCGIGGACSSEFNTGSFFIIQDVVIASSSGSYALVQNDPGTWSESSSGVTPEPSSLLLLGTGLLGLGPFLRRRFTKP